MNCWPSLAPLDRPQFSGEDSSGHWPSHPFWYFLPFMLPETITKVETNQLCVSDFHSSEQIWVMSFPIPLPRLWNSELTLLQRGLPSAQAESSNFRDNAPYLGHSFSLCFSFQQPLPPLPFSPPYSLPQTHFIRLKLPVQHFPHRHWQPEL